MSQDIKRINDPNQLQQITAKVFCKYPVQIQNKTGLFPVKVHSYKPPNLIIVHNQGDAPLRILVVNHQEHKMFLECKVVQKPKPGVEVVIPMRLHLKRQIRKEARLAVAGNQTVAFITNAITLKSIPEYLAATNQKRDMLLHAYEGQLKNMFDEAQILFRKTFRMDQRMRVMSNMSKPIFVPTRMNPHSIDPARFVHYEEYKKIILYDHLPDTIVAEITEPLSYKSLYLFGYIHILSENELSPEDYERVHDLARDFEKEIQTLGLVPTNTERSVVVDINTSGVGFLHPHNPHLLRNFMPGEHILFDIILPNGTGLSCGGIIRNMKSQEKAHRIGVEFQELSEKQKTVLSNYLESIQSSDEPSPE